MNQNLRFQDSDSAAVIEARSLSVGYGDLVAVRDVDIAVRPREIWALLGPNGAGKTTLLRTLAGLLRPIGGEVLLSGVVTRGPLHRRARAGIGYIGDDRSIVPSLSVMDNLRLAKVDVDRVVEQAPALKPLLRRRAGLLSGGEQQLLSAMRALSREPKVLLVDELSQGLSPIAVDSVWRLLREAVERGTAVIAVEQVIGRAVANSDRFIVLRQGEVALVGMSDEYADRLDEIERLHLIEHAEALP